jgi:hypothetical protein
LLPLILPMLVLTRRWRILSGFGAGAAILTAICVASCGIHACADYVQILTGYASKTATGQGGFDLVKFIDLNSSLKLLHVPTVMIFAILLTIVATLAREAIQLRTSITSKSMPLCFAIALTWTLVLNLYVGVYDSILVVPAIVLTAGALLRRQTDFARHLPLRFRCLLLAVWAMSWVSGLIARETGFQPYTIALLCLGVYQIHLLRERARPRPVQKTFVFDRRAPSNRDAVVAA